MRAHQKGETIESRVWLLLWSVPAALFAAAAYELALALDLVGSYAGLAPGQHVEGENVAATVAVFSMLVGSVAAWAHALRPRQPWTVALFAPAAAAFVTTRFYTYDPYYLTTLRRYSDAGAVPDGWILSMLAVAIVVGLLTGLRPRAGSIATAVMLPMLLLTSAAASGGH